MTDREAWVRFACAFIARSGETTIKAAGERADEMLAELGKRELDDSSPARVELVDGDGHNALRGSS